MTRAHERPSSHLTLWHLAPSLRTSHRLSTIVKMRLRVLALAVIAMVFVSAHISHIPLLVTTSEIQETVAHTVHHGMSGFAAGGNHANADAHATDTVDTSACCTDVLLSIPSRPALLSIAALLATAFAMAMHFSPGAQVTWSIPILPAGRRRALLQVYLN